MTARSRVFAGGWSLELIAGDITRVPADAIVNAANSALVGGGGVDGAIHRAGGPSIMEELNVIRAAHGGCPVGSAVATGAGRLPARFVFHAVGPIWRGGGHGEPERLESCYRACLGLAQEHGAERITFPAISAGVYGYPMREAARVALTTVWHHLHGPASVPREVVFVLFSAGALLLWAAELARLGGDGPAS